jgi:anti-sigma B factor antagonist
VLATTTATARWGDDGSMTFTPLAPDTFDVVVTFAEAGVVASVRGEVDIATAPILRSALMDAGAPSPLTVDLAGVTFIDASGLRVLVGAAGRARRDGGELVLRDPSRGLLRVLGVTGLLGTFTIEKGE